MMIHHAPEEKIQEMYHHYSPVFVLSTGRSGTQFIFKAFIDVPNVNAFHEPSPTLEFFSNFAFHNQKKKEILDSIVNTARMESVLRINLTGNIYLESNQCLSFFAPSIKRIFKSAKIIHVVRHPGDFITSAIRKGWHKNDSIWESGRIKMKSLKKWGKLSHVEKLAWVWNTTNRYLSRIGKDYFMEDYLFIRFEDLLNDEEVFRSMMAFCGADIAKFTSQTIQKIQKKKVNEFLQHSNEPSNMKKDPDFPKYSGWPKREKDAMVGIVQDMANEYRYDLTFCYGE